MATPAFKSRDDLDAMIEEVGRQLDQLHRLASHTPQGEVWTGLTRAILLLAAPEDHGYVNERLDHVFSSRGRGQGSVR